VLSAKITADPAVVLDPKVAADPANYRTILLWFDSLDEKTRPAFIEALLPVRLAACKASEREKGCGFRNIWVGVDWALLRSDYPTVFAAVTASCKHGTGDILRARVRDEAAVAARDAEHRKAKEELAKKKERLDALWVVYRKGRRSAFAHPRRRYGARIRATWRPWPSTARSFGRSRSPRWNSRRF